MPQSRCSLIPAVELLFKIVVGRDRHILICVRKKRRSEGVCLCLVAGASAIAFPALAQQLREQAAKIRPTEPRIHENLGQVYLHTDRAADAVKEFATGEAGARGSALPLSVGPGLPSQWRRCAGEAGVRAVCGAERHACDARSAVTQQAPDELPAACGRYNGEHTCGGRVAQLDRASAF